MNGYQRVMTALDRGRPDRVPVFEGAIADNIVEALIPGGDQADVVERYDLDCCYYREAYRYRPVDPDKGYHQDEWGIVVKLEGDIMPSPVIHPIQSLDDLKNFTPPDPRAPHRLAKLREAVERFKGRRAVVLGMSDAYAIPWKLRGMSDFLADMLLNPELVQGIIDLVVEYNRELIRSAAEIGVDVIRTTDDYCFNSGPMMSPELWIQFIQPGLKSLVDLTHQLGIKFIKHCDGLIEKLVEPMVATGIDALHPIEPMPGQSLGQYKNSHGDRLCLIGNVDCKYILTEAGRDEVYEDVRRCLREGAAGGGYMIASSNSIHRGTRPRNFVWYVEAAKEMGAYPIDV
jgi:uroporphyrinogen decarboxylase